MTWMGWNDFAAPAGMVNIRVGDVVQVCGELMVVDYVNDCRARCRPIVGGRVKLETRFGKVAEFEADSGSVNVAVHWELDSIVERLGEDGLKELLAAKAAGRRGADGAAKETNEKIERIMDMARKVKGEVKDKTKARGGLAADKAQDEAADISKAAASEAGIRTRGKLGEVMGFAVTSVMRRLGKEGCSTAHVIAILKANKITPSPATASIQVSAGKKGERGEPAPLTKEQVAELIASATEPVAEPKKDSKKKS